MTIHTAQLQQLYTIFLGRPAGPGGLAFWEQAAASGVSMEAIADSIASSAEYLAAHAGQSNRQIIDAMYQNLFGRPVKAAGVEFWSAARDNGMTIGQLGSGILASAQGADAAAVAAKTVAASSYTDMLAQQDGGTGAALAAKGAVWLSVVTDAASQDVAMDGLANFVAHAQIPVVLDVPQHYLHGSTDYGYHWGRVQTTLVFSGPVLVDTTKGTPTLTMETGANDQIATYVSGSGSNRLVFEFSIKEGDNTSKLDYISSSALALNGGAIKDAAGHDAVLTLPEPGATHSLSGNGTTIIDTTPPVLLSASVADSSTGVATNASIELHFSEKLSSSERVWFTIESADHSQVIQFDSLAAKAFLAYRMSDDQTTITLDPQVGLHANTLYTVTADVRFHDISGNAYGATQFDPEGYDHTPFKQTLLSFTTGDASVPTLVAGTGADAGTLHVGGGGSGDPLVIDLNQHTTSEGVLPGGVFTTIDVGGFGSAVKLQALNGANSHLTGTDGRDTLAGGDAAMRRTARPPPTYCAAAWAPIR